MKKLLAIVLTLCMMMAYLPVGVMASDTTGDGKLHHFIGEEQILVLNNFNNASEEGVPTASNKSFRTASSEGYETTEWTVNNDMYMFRDLGSDNSTAIRFIGNDASAYPGAHISLNEQFFGITNVGEPESDADYQGLTEGVVITEFDIKTDALVSLALLGTGTTAFNSTASSSSDAYIFRSNGYVGTSNTITYTLGEWGKVMVYTNLTEKYMGLYYNGLHIHSAPLTQGYGVKELWDKFGLLFQANEGMVNFAVDNFKIIYSNATHLGFATFNGDELPSSGSLDGIFLPRNYAPVNDLGAGEVTFVEGKDGEGDNALHLAPNGAANPNYKFYYQNKPYKGATTGLLHAKFDVKFDEYFDMGLSGGFGIYFSDQIFTKTGTVGAGSDAKTYSLNTWHEIDVVSDWDNDNFRMYIDGELCRDGTLPYGFVKDEYLQFLIWGRSDVETGKGVAFDNINFTYYNLPRVKSVSSKSGSSFVDSFVDGSNELRLNLTAGYTNIAVADVAIAVNGEEVSKAVSDDTNSVIITLESPVKKGDIVEITVLPSAIVGKSTLAPQGYEYTVSETVVDAPASGGDDGDDPVVPDVPTEPEDTDIHTVDIDPGAPMDVEELTLFPADKTLAYEDDALILKAFLPSEGADVKFTFDQKELTGVSRIDNMYYIALDPNWVSNGDHEFEVEAQIGGEAVSKKSSFYYYSAQKTLVYNDFDSLTSVSSGSVTPESAYGHSSTKWIANNQMTMAKETGSDGEGVAIGLKSGEATGVYPGVLISLNEQFFGVDNVGAPASVSQYAGLTEGVVITEFDAKVNANVGMGFLGTGPSSWASNGGSAEGTLLFNYDGTVGSGSSVKYTLGEWGKVKIISNFDVKSMSLYYNDILIHTHSALNPYGNKELWGYYGLQFQAYKGTVDVVIDNFKISHTLATEIGKTTFNSAALGEALTSYDGHFSPRNYSFSADHASGAVTTVQGKDGEGDVAVHMAVNGSPNPNFKFFFQGKPYKGAKTGALSASFDIRLDNFADVGMSGGFGLLFSPVFRADGKVGKLSYEKDTWYNVKYYADWDKNKAYIYVNDCLATSFNEIPYSMLDNEYFQILVWNSDNLSEGEGITIDNLDFTYYELPEIKVPTSTVGEETIKGKISRKATSVTFPLTSEFKSLAKEDIKVLVDSEIFDAENITFADNAITLSFAEAIGANKKIEITIGKDEIVKTISPIGKDYKVVFTSEDYPADGYSISISKDSETATAHAKFYFRENSDSFYVAIASYVGDKLDKIDLEPVTPESDKEEDYYPSISGISQDADIIKAFIWSDALKPLKVADLDLTSVE